MSQRETQEVQAKTEIKSFHICRPLKFHCVWYSFLSNCDDVSEKLFEGEAMHNARVWLIGIDMMHVLSCSTLINFRRTEQDHSE